MIDFKNKSVVITGSARGIGKAIALKFGGLGANLVIVDMNEEATKATAEELKGLGYNAIAVTCNVTKEEDCAAMVDATVKAFGSVDVLINNAGITKDTLLMRMKKEQWDAVIAVNLTGTYNATQAAIKTMMKQKSGNIVNLTSVVGIDGNAGQTNYAAAKAGIFGFSKSLAREVGSRNITVNCVAPGFIDTDMTRSLSTEHQQTLIQHVPLGRLGRPEEVASAVAFLASSAAGYITGTTLHVNGGMYMD